MIDNVSLKTMSSFVRTNLLACALLLLPLYLHLHALCYFLMLCVCKASCVQIGYGVEALMQGQVVARTCMPTVSSRKANNCKASQTNLLALHLHHRSYKSPICTQVHCKEICKYLRALRASRARCKKLCTQTNLLVPLAVHSKCKGKQGT